MFYRIGLFVFWLDVFTRVFENIMEKGKYLKDNDCVFTLSHMQQTIPKTSRQKLEIS